MSALPPRPARSRTFSRRAAGAGAAGLTAVLAASPFAHAAPAPTSSDTATSAPASPSQAASSSSAASGSTAASASASSSATHAKSATKTGAVIKKKAITADDVTYGLQKYRVGVQVKSGQYVPPGTTTVGTKLHVVETGPDANDAVPGDDFTCTTVAADSSSSSGSGSVSGAAQAKSSSSAPTGDASATYCQPPETSNRVAAKIEARYQAAYGRKLPARLRAMLTTRPTPVDADGDYQFTAEPGDTITITQVDAAPLLRQDPTPTAVLGPCPVDPDLAGAPFCGTGSFTDSTFDPASTDEIFDDLGPLPVANDDSASMESGSSVNVVVTRNDTTSGARISGLAVGDDPNHGTATVLSGSSDAAGPTPTQPPPASSEPISLAPTSSGPITIQARQAAAARLHAAAAAAKVGTTIRYTPKAGFTGTDHFTYKLSTVNGSDTAEVSIKVVAAPSSSASASGASATSTSGSGTAPLAVTGTDTAAIGEVALGLLAAGGVAAAAGRRRQTARGGRTH